MTTYLPQQTADELVTVAKHLGLSQSEVLRRLVEDFLAGADTTTGTAP